MAFASTLLPGRARAARPRTEREFRLFARLKPGATIAQARAEIDALVVGQISVSLVLLVSSGLLVRSLAASRVIDPGFLPRPMLF